MQSKQRKKSSFSVLFCAGHRNQGTVLRATEVETHMYNKLDRDRRPSSAAPSPRRVIAVGASAATEMPPKAAPVAI